MLQQQLQDRFSPVLLIVNQRFGTLDEYRGGLVLPWDLVRALENLPSDELFLAWVRRTAKRDLVPIVRGLAEVLRGLDEQDEAADSIARRALDENLPRAASLFARRWMEIHPRLGPDDDSWRHLHRQ